MEFLVREAPEGGCEAVLLSSECERLLHIRVQRNSIDYWQVGFLKMMQPENGWRDRCQRLLQQAEHLHHCKMEGEDAPLTFLRIMCALARFLDQPESNLLASRITAQQEIHQLLKRNQVLNFRVGKTEGHKSYEYGLIINGNHLLHQYDVDSTFPRIPQQWWTHFVYTQLLPNEAQYLRAVLANYELLIELVLQHLKFPSHNRAGPFALRSFASFSKAVVEILDQPIDFGPFQISWRVMNPVLTIVVENEYSNLEEQQQYLQRIISSKEPPTNKFKRLDSIIRDVAQDITKVEHGTGETRITAIISDIGTYYLSQYDLERAIYFWGFLKKKDWFLRSILALYRSPKRYVVSASVFMSLLTFLTVLNSRLSIGSIPHTIISYFASSLIGLAVVTILFALGFITWRFFIVRAGLEYTELLLPRLLGAIVVGLSVLLFESTTWDIGLKLNWFNWILACLTVYLLSFVYIFIDVHKTLRRLPLLTRTTTDRKQEGHKPWQAAIQNATPMRRSISASFKVFSIGLFEAFLAVLFTSMLFYRVILTPDRVQSFTEKGVGMVWQFGELFSFGFFPKLIILWTGLTLFIGAFVQLLWQDREITSP